MNLRGKAQVSGLAGSQVYSMLNGGVVTSAGDLLTLHSLAEPPLSDPMTDSVVETASSVVGAFGAGDESLAISMTAGASAVSGSAANGGAFAGTDGLQGPFTFAQDTDVSFEIDLISDFGANPDAAYVVQAFSPGNVDTGQTGMAQLATVIHTNLSGLETLLDFRATATLENGLPQLNVSFFSPLIAQSIFESDFVAGAEGTFALDPNKRHLSIPLTIPAGQEFQFDVATIAVAQVVPEPSAVVLAAIGLLGFAAVYSRVSRAAIRR